MPVLCGINRDVYGAMQVAAGKPPAVANGWGIAPDATRYVNIISGAVPAGSNRASGIVYDPDGDLCMTTIKTGARLYQGFLRRDDGVLVATYNLPGAGSRMVHAPIGPLLVDADGAIHISGGFDATGMAAWYRFGAGITSSGGFASAWADQSGNGRNLTQGSGAAQPAVNGDGSLLFNGTSHFMQASFTLGQPTTVCILARQISWTAGDFAYDGFTANTGQIQQITASPQVRLRGTSGLTATGLWALNTYAAVVAVFINGLNASVLRINNGTEIVSGDIGTATAMGGLTLGASGVPSSYGNIEVKEVVVFSAGLDVTRRAAMAAYLAGVGGLTI